ncbi:flagellar hook assembly protein FlgD [Atlantibacter hermannii]|uniref:flagellar hook assembly protein FlgD n=1 Tax=Atlantibacter hermannii TaxID=565 RepID=UPI0028A72E11|nr:flagellar hook assembly protein FlgD [Atlantibacter hermannii]
MSIAVNVNDPTNTGLSGVGGASGAAGVNKTNGLTGNSASDLQSSFLTLLVAQLKNQDPTNPLQNNELTTQLAQISTVSGIEKLNTTLGAVSGQLDSNQSLQASALIDRGVMIPGSSILSGKETTTPFGVELQQAADKVTATITNKDGVVMQTLDIGKLSAGVHTFSWDGKMTDGTAVPDGAYNVTFSASSAGTQLVAQPLNFALVNGVTRSNGNTLLDLGTYGTLAISEVRQII